MKTHTISLSDGSVSLWYWNESEQLQIGYRKLKYQVFVEELGYVGIPYTDGLADEDKDDAWADFVTIADDIGQPVGIGRINVAGTPQDLPGALAFRTEYRHLQNLLPDLTFSAITNIALLPAFRSTRMATGDGPRFSDALMAAALLLAADARADALWLLTNPGSRAEKVFRRFNFHCGAPKFHYQKLDIDANRWLTDTDSALTAAAGLCRQEKRLGDAVAKRRSSLDSPRTEIVAQWLAANWGAC